jgi:DNA polymerase I-like protein with 3'-5' exonuclease and polymerase domains
MTYDYLVRNNRWDDVIKFAEKTPPRNNLSLAMLNLSLAKTNKMGDRMFNFQQNGVDGLFLPFAKEYVAPMMGSEILFQLGLVNASQEYSFESMETTPNLSKTVRSVKRLAETNLINGNYEVAGKYLRKLEKTVFYRKWAKNTEKYLYHEGMINDHPVWGEKRKWMISKDFFFKVQNMESTLNMLMRENPENKMAFQYLMAFYLINKDLRNFMNTLPLMEKMNYSKIPVSYEEAIMYILGLSSNNPLQNIPFKISDNTKSRMKAYAEIYTTRPNAQDLLKKRFSGTYWYYLHYQKIDISNEKK